MNIEDIRNRKAKLEGDMAKLISGFEAECELRVGSVSVLHQAYSALDKDANTAEAVAKKERERVVVNAIISF